MYQQYRQAKKSPTTKWAKILAIVFVLVILGWGLWYLSKIWQKVEEVEQGVDTTKPASITDKWYVGKKVSLSWDLQTSADTAYTHTLKTVWGETIKIFSSSRDLSNYKWTVYTQWIVVKFDWSEYIVDLSAIGTSESDLETISLPTSSSTRILPNIWLKIDLSNRSDITYSNSWSTIILNAEWFSGSVKVEWFRCEVWFPEKDCIALSKTFTEGSFVSAWGMTYSKWPNATWFAYNNAGAWYRVTTDSDAMLYKVSSVLIPINENYIKSLLPQAQKLCATITSLTKNTITKDTLSSWKMILDGKWVGWSVGQCVVRISFTESGESISLEKQTWAQTITTGTTSTTNGWATVAPNSGSVAPVVTASGLVFTSTRWWYSIIYPSAKISYNGTNVQEDLGIAKLNCYIRIDVKDYKDRDDDSVGPWVSIYECTSKESSESLSAKASGYIFKTSADGTKLFFIKVQNAAWSDFASKIKIQ